MKHNVISAIILALGLIVAALVYSGRYYFVRLNDCTVARGDRWTGKVDGMPLTDGKDCKWNF
jgi:hypothetical protein